MLLAVDAGNTNVVFAIFDGGDIRARWRIATDPRRTQIQAAIQVLLRPDDDRAEQLQLIFSRPYDHDWRESFQMTNDE